MKKKAGSLLYYFCLGLVGIVFAAGCSIIYILGLFLDIAAFLGLMGVAFASLVWGRMKRSLSITSNTYSSSIKAL